MARTHPLAPVKPGLAAGRILAGALAGTVGGLVFGVMILTDFVISERMIEGGMTPLVMQLLGTTGVMQVWLLHAATSIGLGIIFALFISPQSYRSSIIWALGYSLGLWIALYLIVLRLMTGTPIQFDAAAAFSLIGHLVYGLALGVVYVAFHNLEIREALDAESKEWREWGKREGDA